jgi:GMP reductase
MLGGMFAGSDEASGEMKSITTKLSTQTWEDGGWNYDIEEKKWKIFYGMSSDYAQEKHFGGIKDYRASEGVLEYVKYTGLVKDTIKEILGSLRSTGTYIGAENIKDFGKCATFVRVNRIHDRNL